MKKLLYLWVLVFFAHTLAAAPVDAEQAGRVAANFHAERSGGAPFIITSIQPVTQANLVLLYIVNGAPGQGFVVVSGDDRVYAVPAYSLNGNYETDTSHQAPAFRAMMLSYASQIQHHIDYSLPAQPEALSSWSHYSAPAFTPSAVMSVPPLLGSIEWGQGCYYNASCPYDINAGSSYCNRVPVGCVATAMSQVMKYWGHPQQGAGSNSYVHPTYGNQSANFGNTTYNWSAMPNSVTSNNPQVATLCYHAAVSVNMQFGPTGSGAYTTDARDALVNYFGYASGATYHEMSYYSGSVWNTMMKTELDNSRPVIYRGNNAVGQDGHAWVMDGYQGTSNDHYHFNWGWSGYQNGYYYLNMLTPGGYNFSYDLGAITGIVPGAGQLPSAGFTANPTNAFVGQTVTFNNSSTGMPTSYRWFFGDGDSSHFQHPTHIYTQAGQFTVTLIASNTNGSDTMTVVNCITAVYPSAPVANFSATPLQSPLGGVIQFTDLSTNYIGTWLWNFGDGQTSTQQNPQHTYLTQDTFTVSLKVTNMGGSDSLTRVDYIIITGALPTVTFSASPLFAYPGDTIFFTDLSTQNPTVWLWNFGDGNTSTLQNPTHTYAVSGAYTITLDATNVNGTNTKSIPFYIYIMPPPPMPMAFFVGVPSTILAGQSVEFLDFSMSNPTSWEWTFAGGTPSGSLMQNPGNIMYQNPGTYDVMLVVSNPTGTDTMFKPNYIVVGSPGFSEPLRDKTLMYPNPASDYVTLQYDEPCRWILLLDMTGRIVLQHKISDSDQGKVTLPLKHLPEGVYTLILDGDQGTSARKLIVSRN